MRPFPVIPHFKQYFWKNLLPAIVIVIGGVIFLNFFLAYRLENYLKQEVKERVAVASDGFYSLTFDDLSINIFNGELKIEGIQLIPDSIVFSQWRTKDSLPLTYLDVTIQQIDFKGVNLIWLKNYRKLNFNSFEVLNPVVHIVDAFYSDRHVRKAPVKRSKTLYEYIDPYIDILSVSRLNIENASVSFLVEHPFTPISYQIEDIDFYAYNFQLDSSSFENGNLLYSEHFEFISSHPQTLLTNNHFTLFTDSIVVNTRDSLIFLKNVHLQPQNTTDTPLVPSVNGEINSLEITGAAFKRVNAFNTLRARALEIEMSDLEIVSIPSPGKPENDTDTISGNPLLHSLSLYDLISPVLNRLSIETIDIQKGSLDYSIVIDDEIDNYKIDKYNFSAYNFLIDSIYEERYGIQYIQNFRLDACGIEAHMPSNNHQVKIDSLMMNTEQGLLGLKNINSNPVSGKQTYLAGKIPSILIHGYKYDNGLSVGNVIIEEPNIRYYAIPTRNKKGKNSTTTLSPYFQYLSVDNFHLKKGYISYREQANRSNWQARNINLSLQDFLINEKTLYGPGKRGFECNKIELYLSSIANKSPEGTPQIKTGKAFYSNQSGILELENIQYNSPETSYEDPSQMYISVNIPHLHINGAENLWNNRQHLHADSIRIEQPEIAIRTALPPEEVKKKAEEYTPFQPFLTLGINHILLNGTQLQYMNPQSDPFLNVTHHQLKIQDLQWNLAEQRTIDLGTFNVSSPTVDWTVKENPEDTSSISTKAKTIPELLYPYAEQFNLKQFTSDNIRLITKQPYLSAEFDIENIQVDSLSWTFKENDKTMQIENILIQTPLIDIHKKSNPEIHAKQTDDSIKTSIYDQLKIVGNEISIHSLQIEDANLQFSQELADYSKKDQKLNQTGFSLTDFHINNDLEQFKWSDIHFHTYNFSYPIDQGFYTLEVEKAELNNQNITIRNFHMNPAYRKEYFAYLHPKHQDWFDVTADRIHIQDIDFLTLFYTDSLNIQQITIDNPVLQNYKNQKIILPPRRAPMIYEGLQKASLPIDIKTVQVNNLEVVYEELAKKGFTPGRLVFKELNGTFSGVTNIVSYPEQYIRLDADGKFYGNGHFNAVWLLPVDSLNDRFILEAHLPDMDLTLLNEIIEPLASARLTGGHLDDLTFLMDAGSVGGSIDMLLLYNNLRVDIFRIKEGERKSRKFINFLANAVVRDNNPNSPDKPRSRPRQSSATIVRDPYHSSFNYLWQLLRPALAESVGISKTQQKIATSITGFITKVKNLFKKEKPKPTDNKTAR